MLVEHGRVLLLQQGLTPVQVIIDLPETRPEIRHEQFDGVPKLLVFDVTLVQGRHGLIEQPVVAHRHVDPAQIVARREKQRLRRRATHHPAPVTEHEQPVNSPEIILSRVLIQKQFQRIAEPFVTQITRVPHPVEVGADIERRDGDERFELVVVEKQLAHVETVRHGALIVDGAAEVGLERQVEEGRPHQIHPRKRTGDGRWLLHGLTALRIADGRNLVGTERFADVPVQTGGGVM